MSRHYDAPGNAIAFAYDSLREYGATVDTGHWQGVPTEGKPDLVTKEILDLDISFPIPDTAQSAAEEFRPNLPWAEDHFLERVSRVPSNPGEQYKNWPWWRGQSAQTMAGTEAHSPGADSVQGKFSHTYQERFWPKQANRESPMVHMPGYEAGWGIRYRLGDLDDVVNLLYEEPYTRQAYLPIFFPEDTGAVHGGRIPCTLGYHFLLRNDLLHLWYEIRSCDAVRHFRDDLYLAARLVQWTIAELVEKELRDDQAQVWVSVDPGKMFFKAHSFHVHMGDYHLLP